MLRRTLTEALAAAGQDQAQPADPRSVAQPVHDRRFGVEPRSPAEYEIELPKGFKPADGVAPAEALDGAREFAAALSMPADLAAVVVAEMLGNEAPEPEEMARLFGPDRSWSWSETRRLRST